MAARTLMMLATLMLSAPVVGAASAEPKASLLRSKPAALLLHEILELKPAQGYHFNVKAPQSCGGFPILSLTPRTLRCQMAAAGPSRISVNLCGDDASICIPEEFTVAVLAPKGHSAELGAAAPAQPPKGRQEAIPGFIMNDPGKALREARAGESLLLIDFYAAWCPPCNMLAEEVWPDQAVRGAAQGLVKAALDSDSDVSWPWKAHFKVGGYPTVILADHRLRELGRFVSSRPPEAVLAWLQETRKLKDEPVTEAAKRLKGGKASDKTPARAKRVGLWHFERGEYAEAVAVLKGLPDKEARKTRLKAEMKLADAQDMDGRPRLATRRKQLDSLIREFPDDVEVGGWVESFFELDEDAALKLLPAARKSLKTWRSSPRLAPTGYTPGDLLYKEARLVELSGDKEQARSLYLDAARYYEGQTSRSSLSMARGANLERAYCLKKAGKAAESRALYETLAKTYAEEFVFNYEFADLLHEEGESQKALDYARKAEEYSYGDNWLRAVALEAEIELDLGRPKAARAALEEALGQAVLPSSTDIRSHRYMAKLRALLEKCSK